MKSLLELHPNIIGDNYCREVAKHWQECLVSFHARRPHHDNYIETIGTGFLVAMGDETFIATARHTLDNYQSADGIGVIIGGGISVSLNGMRIAGHPTLDVAMIEVPQDALLKAGIRSVRAMPAMRPSDSTPTASFVIFGYPSSKNVLDMRTTRPIGIMGIMLHGYEADLASTEIRFSYRAKDAVSEPWNPVTNPPALKGMSGSPVAQVFIRNDTSALTLRCVGVFNSWRSKKSLVAYAFPQWLEEQEQESSHG